MMSCFKRQHALVAAALLGAMLMGASCSTTRGSLYSSSVSRDQEAAAEAKRRAEEKRKAAESKPAQPESPSGPVVPSLPDRPSSSSSYGSNSDYYARSSSNDAIFRLIVEVARAAASGSLNLSGLPPGASLRIDGHEVARVSGGGDIAGIRLDMGLHYVEVRAFGWQDWKGSVEIGGLLQQTSINVSMQPADFTIDGFAAEPALLDAAAPGRLGETEISFSASGSGRAVVQIRDPEGSLVYIDQNLSITGERTSFRWGGKDRRGRALPPGEYRVDIVATGGDGLRVRIEGLVTLGASHTTSTYSSLAGGFSGSLLAPDARVLPAGRFQAGIGGYAVVDPAGADLARMPAFGGLRLGFPGGVSEFALSWMGVFYPGYGGGDLDSWSAAASLKTRLYEDETWGTALILGGSYASFFGEYMDMPAPWDGPARYRGAYAGLIAESDSELARAYASVQLEVSDYYPNYELSGGGLPGFYTWTYLRGGLEFFLPDFLGSNGTVSVSAAGRTSPFSQGLSLTLPLSIGAELHWYLPGSPSVLSVYASGEWASKTSFYLGGGLGFGLML